MYMLFRPQMDCRILEHVLNRNPSLALFQQENRFSGAQSLLQTLCAQWIHVIRNNENLVPSSSSSNNISSNSNSKDANVSFVPIARRRVHSDCKLLDRWTKLVLLARAAHRMTHAVAAAAVTKNTVDATTKALCKIPELHLALQLKCSLPPVILCQFIEMYPEQASKPMRRKYNNSKNANATILLQTNTNNSRVAAGSSIDIDIDMDIDRTTTKRMRTIKDDATTTSKTMSRRFSDEDDDDTDSTSNNMMLPLHYFLSEYPMTQTTAPKTMATRTCVSDRFVPVGERGSPLQHLVRAFPEAASIGHASHCGSRWKQQQYPHNLPLHMAIASGIPWTNGLRELVYANPSALDIKHYELRSKSTQQLVPFLQQASKQQASCHKKQHEHNGDEKMVVSTSCQTATTALNTAYCLLREDPSVLSRMVAL